MDDTQYRSWKQHMVPFLYDWVSNHNLTWPSQTCRWGPKLEDSSHKTKYRLYISEQTDGSEPQKLTVCTADIFKPRVAGPEAVSNWSEFSKSPHVKEHKVIFHPGEVNKIRELPQHPNVIVTHTDAPELFVWNVDKQPSRQRKEEKYDKRSKVTESIADLQLVGHEDNAQFPLATCSSQPLVASGGTDHLVLTWNLQDSVETVLSGAPAGAKQAPTLQASQRLEGHGDTVEDVVFKPGSAEQLASVGDDHQFLLWDTRTSSSPVKKVATAHGSHDIHCVDWSALQEECIATGAADGSLKVWDLRKLGGTKNFLFKWNFHTEATMRVEWHPHAGGVLASGGDDRIVALWDINRKAPASAATGTSGRKQRESGHPPQLMFQHLGHKNGKVVDFQWNAHDIWLMMSVSDDTDGGGGGGTLQLWRINDMIYVPEPEVLEELERHRRFILSGNPVSSTAGKPTIAVPGTAKASTTPASDAATADADARAAPAPANIPEASTTTPQDVIPDGMVDVEVATTTPTTAEGEATAGPGVAPDGMEGVEEAGRMVADAEGVGERAFTDAKGERDLMTDWGEGHAHLAAEGTAASARDAIEVMEEDEEEAAPGPVIEAPAITSAPDTDPLPTETINPTAGDPSPASPPNLINAEPVVATRNIVSGDAEDKAGIALPAEEVSPVTKRAAAAGEPDVALQHLLKAADLKQLDQELAVGDYVEAGPTGTGQDTVGAAATAPMEVKSALELVAGAAASRGEAMARSTAAAESQAALKQQEGAKGALDTEGGLVGQVAEGHEVEMEDTVDIETNV